jgi:hypothetical protein
VEPVPLGDRVCPVLNSRTLDLDGAPAGSAHQVVVVPPAAPAIERLAVVHAQDVDLAGVGKALQRAVDRRQPDAVASAADHAVDLLRAAEAVQLGQGRAHGQPLPGRSVSRQHGVGVSGRAVGRQCVGHRRVLPVDPGQCSS